MNDDCHRLEQGDCLHVLKAMADDSIDLVYLDPPFFTQKTQKLSPRDRSREFSFNDTWKSIDAYAQFMYERLSELHRVLKPSGSLFFHCDRNASHIARLALDEIFGSDQFRSEIIWYYRRWSASQRTLLPAHQNIFFYSKTNDYKFNELFQDYSASTNVDQILQKRQRDESGKAIYMVDNDGNFIANGKKKGVPLSDVWDIPYLNPKARERTGYPTQKPVLLLEKIIEIATDKGDLVLDPFCGSGTTLVAASLLGRRSIGIDIAEEAISIARNRLTNPTKTRSNLLEAGRESYETANSSALTLLGSLDIVPVQRNKGIDAFLNEEIGGALVPIRVQQPGESLLEAANALHRAGKVKQAKLMILVATSPVDMLINFSLPPEVLVIDSTENAIQKAIHKLHNVSPTPLVPVSV